MFTTLFSPFIHTYTTVNALIVVNFVVENKTYYVVLPQKTPARIVHGGCFGLVSNRTEMFGVRRVMA